MNKHHDLPPRGLVPYPPPQIGAGEATEYAQFWQLWQREKFYECHEVLEQLWRRTAGRERWFYNGLINCAVAVYQHRRGNALGAVRQFWRAQVKLRPFQPNYKDVDIDALLDGVGSAIAASLTGLTPGQERQRPALQAAITTRMARDFSANPGE